MKVSKIVITGGPCAGKSTAMSWIQNAFTQMGYTVLFIPETATELITAGVSPTSCGSVLEYQTCQLKLQIEKEKVFLKAARTMPSEKILIVCDRGALDNKAYMNESDFAEAAKYVNSNEVALRDNYDAVFHLVTAAKGAREYYTTTNNSARTEDAEQATIIDDKLIAAWTGHPHLRVINNSTDDEVRIRQRGIDGNYIYFQTIKRKISELKRIEIERRLSQEEFLKLMMEADTTRRQIRKTRYCLTYNDQYFEIDIYPFWKDKAIAEIEINYLHK